MEKNNVEVVLEKGKLETCKEKLFQQTGYQGEDNPYHFNDEIYSIIDGETYGILQRAKNLPK